MTDAERILWETLRRDSIANRHFRRQVPIGSYIVDFVCHAARLVVEVDGGQHDQHDPQERARTAFLESTGYRVLRFWNNEVLSNMEGVWMLIEAAVSNTEPPTPSPPSPVEGEGEEIRHVKVIHSLAEALAALDAAAGEPIALVSPPATATSWGADWFAALIALIRAARPGVPFGTIIDCGQSAGHAADAITQGFDAIIFTGSPLAQARLADLSQSQGVRLLTQRL